MSDIFVQGNVYQGTTQACIADLTPPTFAGIVGLIVGSRGQLRASWAAASDATVPLRYEIYCQPSTATGLFVPGNIVGITDALQFDFWTLKNGSFLQNGVTYYVGVRARDAVSNIDGNTVSLNAISTGILTSQDVYLVDGAFALGANSMFQGTLWILKNSVLGTGSTLGTASYQVYDKLGNAVPGMGQSGIIADANGQFKITPVASSLSETLDHYMVKIDITMDSAVRTGYVAVIEPIPEYEVKGAFGTNNNSQFVGTFFAVADGQNVTNLARLGLGHFHVHDSSGNPVVALTESSISPNAEGQYVVTPITTALDVSNSVYFVHMRIEVDGVLRESTTQLAYEPPSYEAKGQFSINASNQLQATFWATENGVIKTSNLGAANYVVRDASGNAVSGLTQSGITADGNGLFIITPVLATLLTDLTHYTVKIGIVVDGVERICYRGFTLLGN